jgi:hypothetical protein
MPVVAVKAAKGGGIGIAIELGQDAGHLVFDVALKNGQKGHGRERQAGEGVGRDAGEQGRGGAAIVISCLSDRRWFQGFYGG